MRCTCILEIISREREMQSVTLFSHLSVFTLSSVPAQIRQMFSVFCNLSCHLLSSHFLFHQISTSQFCSASISLSIYRHLQYISRGLIYVPPLHMTNPSQPLLSDDGFYWLGRLTYYYILRHPLHNVHQHPLHYTSTPTGSLSGRSGDGRNSKDCNSFDSGAKCHGVDRCWGVSARAHVFRYLRLV